MMQPFYSFNMKMLVAWEFFFQIICKELKSICFRSGIYSFVVLFVL